MCDYPLEIRDAARPLTVDELKIMKPHTIFAHGLAVDDYCEKLGAGINLTGSKITLRWVAVRGGRYYDWAVYAHLAGQDLMFIALYGDKVGCESNIRGVVPCDDDAYALYRF